jgi:ligand-binding sensor domain-containing protein
MILRPIIPIAIATLWTAVLPCLTPTVAAQDESTRRPAVTDGLIHYWPDLWDAYDEVSKQQGFVMGILPHVEAGALDETPFHDETGWVQLPVNIPAERALTVSVWIKTAPAPRGDGVALAFHSRGQHWWLSNSGPGEPGTHRLDTVGLDARDGPELILPRESWQHFAFTRSAIGEATLWKNGIAQAVDELSVAPGAELEWITAGNDLKGDRQWFGQLQDLCVFDRILSEQELGHLHEAGRSGYPSRNSAVRQAALERSDDLVWSTYVVRRSIDQFTRRRYTAEDGLPANKVQAVVQTRDGYLWIGTDMGLARFDGQRFRTFTENNTSVLAEVGADILSLAESPDGTLWAGAYGGLLHIRGTEITGYTAGLPERFILHVAPAEDGAIWIAGFRLDRDYRGPCHVRRYHPETGQTSAEVSVPGHVRRLVPTADGVWMATEDPEQLLFWDVKSRVPTVVAKITGHPLKVGLRAKAVVPGGGRMQGWRNPQDPRKEIIEIGVDDELTFHWLTPRLRSGISASRWISFRNPDSWIGAEPGFARILEDRLEQIDFEERTQQPEITCLGSNREGGVWVGTYSDGIQLIRERLVQVFTTRDELSGNDIRSVVATRDGTVLAGGPAGLDELRDGQWTRRGARTPTPLSAVISIAQDAFGTVWVGHGDASRHALQYISEDSTQALNRSRFEWAHPSSLAVTSEGRLWTACDRGITSLDLPGAAPRSGSSADYAAWVDKIVYRRFEAGGVLPEGEFLKMLPDRDGALWVGTFGKGLLRLRDDQVEFFTVEDGLPSNVCTPAQFDETGALWIVAKGAVARRHNGRFQSLGPREGIPDDQFLDLIADDLGHFWLPGLRGIHRLERSQLEAWFDGRIDRVQSLTLGMRDGLLTPDCTSMHYPITAKTADGRIWVATRTGVASFDPSRVEVDGQPLAASIEQIIINRSPIIDPSHQPPDGHYDSRQVRVSALNFITRPPAWSLRIGSGSGTDSTDMTPTGRRRAISASRSTRICGPANIGLRSRRPTPMALGTRRPPCCRSSSSPTSGRQVFSNGPRAFWCWPSRYCCIGIVCGCFAIWRNSNISSNSPANAPGSRPTCTTISALPSPKSRSSARSPRNSLQSSPSLFPRLTASRSQPATSPRA